MSDGTVTLTAAQMEVLRHIVYADSREDGGEGLGLFAYDPPAFARYHDDAPIVEVIGIGRDEVRISPAEWQGLLELFSDSETGT